MTPIPTIDWPVADAEPNTAVPPAPPRDGHRLKGIEVLVHSDLAGEAHFSCQIETQKCILSVLFR